MAATIQVSVVLEDHVQHDGRRRIVEVHADSDGVEHRLSYLAEADHDASRELSMHASRVNTQIALAEANKVEAARRKSMQAKVDAYVMRADPLIDIGLSVEEKTILDEEGRR